MVAGLIEECGYEAIDAGKLIIARTLPGENLQCSHQDFTRNSTRL
jgi:predicted dinucleotide-binding enzyme